MRVLISRNTVGVLPWQQAQAREAVESRGSTGEYVDVPQAQDGDPAAAPIGTSRPLFSCDDPDHHLSALCLLYLGLCVGIAIQAAGHFKQGFEGRH